jgi:hypothetical protein
MEEITTGLPHGRNLNLPYTQLQPFSYKQEKTLMSLLDTTYV